jgi:PhzF family phenazine biosynthesis protein
MTTRPFKQVDVFTAGPYLGNPLAVVMDGTGLPDDAMQQFAAWTNLSETTFVLPPTPAGLAGGADYRVRIFTPGGELPFAGHPTLGTCHAWLQAGGQPKASNVIVQECAVGLITLRRDADRLAFAAPALRRSEPGTAQQEAILQALGVQAHQVRAAQLLDNGPVWLGLLLDSPSTVLALQPDHLALKALGVKIGVVAIEQATASNGPAVISRSSREAKAFMPSVHASSANESALAPAVEVRGFAAPIGVNEDPVTGSLNASLAQWLIAEGHAPTAYVATQGTCLNRHGQVHIHQDDAGQVWVGGQVVTCIDGTVNLD